MWARFFAEALLAVTAGQPGFVGVVDLARAVATDHHDLHDGVLGLLLVDVGSKNEPLLHGPPRLGVLLRALEVLLVPDANDLLDRLLLICDSFWGIWDSSAKRTRDLGLVCKECWKQYRQK